MPSATTASRSRTVLVDTTTAIALLLEDHASHAAVLAAVRERRLGLAGHAWFETYSVLTRLPPGLRRSPADALKLLTTNFPATAFLDEGDAAKIGAELAELGISGGSVYYALVAAAARTHRRRLLSGDSRARSTYEALGVDVERVPGW